MDPVLVEVTRGARVESAHRGAAIVVDAKGGVLFSAGDADLAVYSRSAVKALLALPMVESGAAARLGLNDAEIALACSSHSGEEDHVATATSMLAKAGRDVSTLECGTHWPSYDGAARAFLKLIRNLRARDGEQPRLKGALGWIVSEIRNALGDSEHGFLHHFLGFLMR